MKSISVPVLNSLVFIRDASAKELPEIDGLTAFWETPTCVAVTCLPDSEGETLITIGSASEMGRSSKPLLDRQIETPSHSVIIEDVLGRLIATEQVSSSQTRLRVWTNGHRATDKIGVALD